MQVERTRGFTLVELLAVIGVMAALVGLLMPVVHQARSAAHTVRCKGNLLQFGRALVLYMDDHGDYIPRRGQGTRPTTRIDRPSDWFNALLPYAGSPPYCELAAEGTAPREGDDHVLICPSAKDPGSQHFFPYAMNMYLSPWIRPMQHRVTDIPFPGAVVFMADAPGPYSATIPSDKAYSVVARHAGKACLVFLDQHVEAHDGSYLGCGVGDPGRSDVRWETGTGGVNWQPGT